MDTASASSTDNAELRRQRRSAVDKHVAERIRKCRKIAGLSQKQLAHMIGTTLLQVSRYECAINRVSAGILHKIAVALNVPISYFYEGLQPGEEGDSRSQHVRLQFLRCFSQIDNEKHQEALCGMARALAALSMFKAKTRDTS